MILLASKSLLKDRMCSVSLNNSEMPSVASMASRTNTSVPNGVLTFKKVSVWAKPAVMRLHHGHRR